AGPPAAPPAALRRDFQKPANGGKGRMFRPYRQPAQLGWFHPPAPTGRRLGRDWTRFAVFWEDRFGSTVQRHNGTNQGGGIGTLIANFGARAVCHPSGLQKGNLAKTHCPHGRYRSQGQGGVLEYSNVG